jgi:predicted RNA binding protein YcfA (HicA-like mRNA interferase family)
MGSIPVLKPREVVALLEILGFTEIRQRGSHKQFRHPDGRCTTVPFHAGRDISPILLRQIAKDIGLPVEELLTSQRK